MPFLVVQPEIKSDLEARVEALEKEVYKASKSKKEVEELSGPPEAPIRNIRCLKALFAK
jgi:hypothetical protein